MEDKLSTMQVADYLHTTHELVGRWCRLGYLRYTTLTPNPKSPKRISLDALVDFLVMNPDYMERLRNQQYAYGIRKKTQEYLIQEVDKRPKYYTVKDVSDIFLSDPSTVLTWLRLGKMKSCYKNASKQCIISEDDMLDALDTFPHFRYLIRKDYTPYNRERTIKTA